MSRIWLRARLSVAGLSRDRRGIAATEFAMIVPIMLVMFFGTVEFSSGVAVDRKVTLVAQNAVRFDVASADDESTSNVDDTYLQNVFTASIAIMRRIRRRRRKATVSEIYIDPATGSRRLQWSKAATIGSGATPATLANSTRNAGDVVTVPPTFRLRTPI